MATEMMTWARRQVFEEFGLSQNEAMVLLLIADNASWNEEEGAWTAWPSQTTLARDARAGERSVRRAVSRLVELGILSTQRRKTQGGFLRGNVYVLHPEIVNRPVTLTVEDRVTGPEEPNSGRQATVAGLEIPREATLAGTSSDPHDSKRGHTGRSVDNSAPTGHSGLSDRTPVSGLAREVNARASLNHHSEPSSSSSSTEPHQGAVSSSASAGAAADDDDDRSGTDDRSRPAAAGDDRDRSGREHRGVNLSRLGQLVTGHTGTTVETTALVWLIDELLARSPRRVGRPDAFVAAAVANDPDEVADMLRGQLPVTAPAPGVVTGQATGRRVLCPIPEHGESSYLEVNCPACRFGDFPSVLDRPALEALRPEISDRVREAVVTGEVTIRDRADDQGIDRSKGRTPDRSGDRSPEQGTQARTG